MQVEWAEDLSRTFETHIWVLVRNGKGVLAQVASAISAAEADITHLGMDPEPAEESIELRLIVSVRDRAHLADVLRAMRRSPVVLRVSRYRSD
jgi:GTP pyrophosphokinase/guanosine-3',5'-bis(diphosphate) 3'-pyrophosphohydrolase